MIRRLLLMVAVVLGLLTLSQPAQAGTYEFSCGFVLDPPVIDVGGDVHIVGSGFEPGTEVDFFIDGELLGTAVVGDDADGNIEATFPLPDAFAIDGEYTITAECPDGNVASNVLIVGQGVVTTTTTAPPLVPTGSDSTVGLVRLGVGLIAVGGLVLLLSRRRAAHHVAA